MIGSQPHGRLEMSVLLVGMAPKSRSGRDTPSSAREGEGRSGSGPAETLIRRAFRVLHKITQNRIPHEIRRQQSLCENKVMECTLIELRSKRLSTSVRNSRSFVYP